MFGLPGLEFLDNHAWEAASGLLAAAVFVRLCGIAAYGEGRRREGIAEEARRARLAASRYETRP